MKNIWTVLIGILVISLIPGKAISQSPIHFIPVGDPTSTMNIAVLEAKIDGTDLVAGDEIGIFDGNLCVGAFILTNSLGTHSDGNFAYVKAYAAEEGKSDGFIPGHDISYRIWDQSKQTEARNVQGTCFNNQSVQVICPKFEIGGTTFVDLASNISCILTVSQTSFNVGYPAGNTAVSITFTDCPNQSWSVTDNASWLTITPASGTGNAIITAGYSENTTCFNREATITVTSEGASGSPKTITVVQGSGATTPGQPGIISGSASPCQGSSQTYSVAAVAGATSYTWTLPSGWTGSSTSSSITATVGFTAGAVSVKAVNNCGPGPERTLNVTVLKTPEQPGTISGAANPCQGSSQTYSVAAVSGATTYTWTLPSGWTGNSTSNSITAVVGSSDGAVSVKAGNSCGTSAERSLNITVQKLPEKPGPISGSATPCQGSSQIYSVAAVSGALSYTWTLPSGWTGNSTTNTITAIAGSESGSISCRASNNCGPGASQTLAVQVQTKPNQPGPVSGNAAPGIGSTQTYSVEAVPGATSYTWSFPAGWTGGSTSNSVTTKVGLTGGTISVMAINSCGSSQIRILDVTLSASISAIQGTGSESPYKDVFLKITGTVTGVLPGTGYFVQDAAALWSGIWVSDTKTAVLEGTGVVVEGLVQEINKITTIHASQVQFINPPVVISPINISSPNAVKFEQNESVLVKLKGVRFQGSKNPDGSWMVKTSDYNTIDVDDLLYPYFPVDGHYYDVTGIVYGADDVYKLEPRKAADITDLSIGTQVTDLNSALNAVYPNPFRDFLYIQGFEKVEKVALVNMKGQVAMEIRKPGTIINTSKLASGIYVINLYSESGLARSFRVVKN